MTFADINESVKSFFGAFNILDYGLVVAWIIGSVFLANEITEKKDEKILTTLIFFMFGGLIFFAEDPFKWILLVVSVLLIIYGMFKILWKKKTEVEYYA